jgi:glycosyltransferase involved in cell wall biosynthesis
MNRPRVSVITPTYNRAHLLPRVWASLQRQTLTDFQWIVVDDGSCDDTRQVVASFADPRICYVHQNNQGCNVARNRGEQEVAADYVAFLDSDDELYAADTLDMMLSTLSAARPEIGMAYFTVVDGEGRQGLFHLEGDVLEAGYEDRVCGVKVRGEFMPFFRREVLLLTPWPRHNGMESLRHWRLAKSHLALFVRQTALLIHRPTQHYHRRLGDNLTGAPSAIRRAQSMAQANLELIAEHRAAWLQHCPCELGRHLFYAAMYLALDGQTGRSLRTAFSALLTATWDIRHKTIVLIASLVAPASLRRFLFLRRAQGWQADSEPRR